MVSPSESPPKPGLEMQAEGNGKSAQKRSTAGRLEATFPWIRRGWHSPRSLGLSWGKG